MQKEKQINEKEKQGLTNVQATKQILNKVLNEKERQALSFMVDKILNSILKDDNIDQKAQKAIDKIISLRLGKELEKEMITRIKKEVEVKKAKINNGLSPEVVNKARWVISQLSVIKKALTD